MVRENMKQTWSNAVVFVRAGILAVWVGSLAVAVPAGVAAETQEQTVTAGGQWVTPKVYASLAPHPRLFVTDADIARMVAGRGADFQKVYALVEAVAATGLEDTENPMTEIDSWSRPLQMQGRLLSLAIQWHRTKDRKYLEAALANMDAMKTWMHPDMITLAEGQTIAGLAITYDLLYNDLTDKQRAWMVELAREHFMLPFLRATGPGDRSKRVKGENRSWWQGIISNWNPVSISGGGLLALAMYEELPEAQTMLDRVNYSYQPIFDYLNKTQGGWVEGLGYWNWSIHYMSLFLVSYERATGTEHEQFRSPGFRSTLSFGTYFVPHGEPCGFGDNQHGNFSASLMRAAEQLGESDALLRLQDNALRMQMLASSAEPEPKADEDAPVNSGYGEPQRLLIAPDPLEARIPPEKGLTRHYPEQGWSMLADQWPQPAIYAAVRGGELGGAHTHQDLLSWFGVIGSEQMIHNIWHAKGSSAAFGPRDKDIFERRSESKNTLFIGGLPASRLRRNKPPRAETTILQLPTGPALRLDASRAFWLGIGNPKAVYRLFAVLGDKALLVLDRVVCSKSNPVEARAYTQKQAVFAENSVILTGEREVARMTFASDQPARLQQASALMTLGNVTPPVMMRWQTLDKVQEVTLATLLSHGGEEVALAIDSDAERIVVTAIGSDWRHSVTLSPTLEPLE